MESECSPLDPIDWEGIFHKVRSALSERYGERVEERSGNSEPFKVLVSTVISLRTKDEVTAAAAGRLLARAQDAGALAAMQEQEISDLIYPAGFYRNKARHLRRIATILVEDHGGRVPASMDDLLALPGVGRKTANLVRGRSFALPAICVDTHVHRTANRLGWISTRTPEQTERCLERILPRHLWIEINGLLVRFGQRICTPVSPRCSICPLSGICPRDGVRRCR
jgi:endonuclease-3